jgi:hypothetical protein
VAKARYLFYVAGQPGKIDSAKPSLIELQEFVSVSEKQVLVNFTVLYMQR